MHIPVLAKRKSIRAYGTPIFNQWSNATVALCYTKIVNATWMHECEYSHHGWTIGPLVLELDTGIFLYSVEDWDEGGAIRPLHKSAPPLQALQAGINEHMAAQWQKKADKMLKGATIELVYYLEPCELKTLGWEKGSACLQLDTGALLMPSTADGCKPAEWVYRGVDGLCKLPLYCGA